jgi:hypothetical protein
MRPRRRSAVDRHPELALGGLPLAPARPRAGVPNKGQAKPTPHEAAILRRAAAGYITLTQSERGAVYRYDDGAIVRGASGNPLTAAEFARLTRNGWLIGDRDAMWGGPSQVYRGRRPPP